MSRFRFAFAFLPLIASAAFAAETAPPPAAAPAAPPVATVPAGGPAAAKAPRPDGARREKRIPGRVVIAEILSIDQDGKAMKLKALNGDLVDVSIEDTSRMPEKPLAVGEMVRCRFDDSDGKNTVLFAQMATQAMKMRAKRAAGESTAEPEPVAPPTSAGIAPIR